MKNWSKPEELSSKKFLSPKELTEILNISLPTVYRLIEMRKFPAYKVGKSLRVLKDDLVAFLDSQKLDQF